MQKSKLNIPQNLKGKHLEAYTAIGENLIKEKKYLGAFLSGSILHGGAGPNSDLDIIAIIDSKKTYSQRINGYVSNTFYELFVYSKKGLLDSFERQDYNDMNMVGFGYLMFGDKAKLENMQQRARKLFLQGPKKFDSEKIKYLKYLLWDRYCDILDIVKENPNLASSMMHEAIWYGLNIFYSNKRVWFPKRKKLLESLSKVDIKLYNNLILFFKTNNLSKRLRYFKLIIGYIITPHKIDSPFIWKGKIKRK